MLHLWRCIFRERSGLKFQHEFSFTDLKYHIVGVAVPKTQVIKIALLNIYTLNSELHATFAEQHCQRQTFQQNEWGQAVALCKWNSIPSGLFYSSSFYSISHPWCKNRICLDKKSGLQIHRNLPALIIWCICAITGAEGVGRETKTKKTTASSHSPISWGRRQQKRCLIGS